MAAADTIGLLTIRLGPDFDSIPAEAFDACGERR